MERPPLAMRNMSLLKSDTFVSDLHVFTSQVNTYNKTNPNHQFYCTTYYLDFSQVENG